MSQQQRFTFVNVSTPQDTRAEGNKKRIRSAAATSGWAQGARPRNLDRQKPHDNSQLSKIVDDVLDAQLASVDERHDPHRGPASTTEEINEVPKFVPQRFIWDAQPRNPSQTSDISGAHPRTANVKRKRVAQQESPPSQRETSSLSLVSTVSSPKSPFLASSSTSQGPETGSFAQASSVSGPHDLGNGSSDLFNTYPVPTKPWFHQVLHHMLTVFAPRGWPALGITYEQGISWERFMTQHALAEPALFNVRLLFASGDMIRMKTLKPETSLWLQDQAVRSINEALNDPARAISDGMILAVGRIALHESLYGDQTAANFIHRPAQHRMITMRGGMGALEFPELVKRLMRWADRVMSLQSDTPRFLPDDDKDFSLGQSFDVLEKWVPQQGVSLRQKIAPGVRQSSSGGREFPLIG